MDLLQRSFRKVSGDSTGKAEEDAAVRGPAHWKILSAPDERTRRAWQETLDELARRGTEPVLLRASDGHDLDADWAALRDSGATVLFVEAPAHALAISRLAEAEGLQIPRDLSIIALADPSRGTEIGPDFTRLSPPRTQLGSEALALLGRILDPRTEVPADELRITLPCAITDGATLAAPRTETTR